jgi:hypothetical protein
MSIRLFVPDRPPGVALPRGHDAARPRTVRWRAYPLIVVDQPLNPEHRLSEQDAQTLLEQFVDAHTHAEDSYDEAIRILAAGGVAVTASIATARHGFSGAGVAAMVAFIVSLGVTLASHQTSRRDMESRIELVHARTYDLTRRSRLTALTQYLNDLAGVALLAGAVLLSIFVSGFK